MGSVGGDMFLKQEAKVLQKEGIVSILGGSARPAASLRRTLSADMMSKTWLSQNGFISNMKKIASSEEFSRCISEYSDSSAGEEEDDNYEKPKPADELDIWSLIVSQSQNKDKEEDKSAAPYVHPLVKKSKGALSKKSLEVCTESLGSETGSDGFSSHPSSEMGDTEEEQKKEQQQSVEYEDVRVVKYNFAAVGKKLPPPCFPPPLASLASRGDGPSLRVKPRRENGRLVLEAVSVSKQNNFKAERQDGRLVLTFATADNCEEEGDHDEIEEGLDEMEEYFGQSSDGEDYEYEDEDDETEDELEETSRGREIEIMIDQAPKTSSGVIKLHRLALMMNKSASLATMNNPTCPQETLLAKTLPPPVAGLNAYDYCWRAKPTAAQAMEKNSNNKHMISKNNSSIIANNEQHQQELVVIKSDNYIVPNLKGSCKERRRSLFREPYCIATS